MFVFVSLTQRFMYWQEKERARAKERVTTRVKERVITRAKAKERVTTRERVTIRVSCFCSDVPLKAPSL